MLFKIGSLLLQIIYHLFRRGTGIFKLLFAIDDFFRLFTMAILMPIFFNWVGLHFLAVPGLLLGLVIDIHDFVTEFSRGKVVFE